ncbi:MAG: carbohydrate kinase [Paludibacteraceae bacterium]
MMRYIIGLGEVLFDCLPTGRKLGGAPANFVFHASQFFPAGQDIQGCAISAIGKDELGKEVTDTLDGVGLHYCLPEVDFPTGTVQVTLNEQGVPQYEICLGVAWDNVPLTDEIMAVAEQARVICFGSLAQRSEASRKTIQAILGAAPADCVKVFDINLRQQWYNREVIIDSLNRSNILKINDEELQIVAPMLLGVETETDHLIAEDKEMTLRVCRALIELYDLQMVILTCGTNGSYVITLSDCSFLPTPKVEVADTVGAGDSFTGTFVAQLLLGHPIPEAHRKAVAVSAFVCTQHGPMPVLPEELK